MAGLGYGSRVARMTGTAQWVFEGGTLHARLLAEGWEQTKLRRYVFGSGVAVMLVLLETTK